MSSSAAPLVALIAAAGIGSRMADSTTQGKSTPKQYLPLQGKPVLLRSIQALAGVSGVERMVVVLHPEDTHWSTLDIASVNSDMPLTAIAGSDTRAGSVLAGLSQIMAWVSAAILPEDVQVLVHDAARPLVRRQSIERLIRQVAEGRRCGGLLATPASDTLKLASVDGDVEKTLNRDLVWRAQTPQLFKARELHAAIESALASEMPVTDEASAMELAGYRPLLVAGDNDNIKLTHSLDFPLAEILLRAQETE